MTVLKLPPGAFIENGWIVYGDQAFRPNEWKRRTSRPYRRLTDEERAHYKRDYMRRWRAAQKVATHRAIRSVGSLHDLACTGPTKATGCVCRKVMLYQRVEAA